jgi:hypothetical protein
MRTSIVVTPTLETVRRMNDIVQGTVLVFNGDIMSIEIVATEASPAPVWAPSDNIYTDVQVKDVQVDTQIATNGAITRLIAWCDSASLNRRRKELVGPGQNTLFAWVLLYDVPPGRSAKLTIAHLTDVLVYREPPFNFSDEMLLQV